MPGPRARYTWWWFSWFFFYRSDMWVMTPRIGRVWGRFHHRVACRLTGRKLMIGRYRVWIYPLLEDEMTEAGMQEVAT